MFERAGITEVFASLALAAASIGGVSVGETLRIDPVRTEAPLLPAAYIPLSELPRPDTNGEPYGSDTTARQLPQTEHKRSYSVKRVYGRKGQLGNRTRGDVRSFLR